MNEQLLLLKHLTQVQILKKVLILVEKISEGR